MSCRSGVDRLVRFRLSTRRFGSSVFCSSIPVVGCSRKFSVSATRPQPPSGGGECFSRVGQEPTPPVHGIKFRTRGGSVFSRLVLAFSSVSQLPKFPPYPTKSPIEFCGRSETVLLGSKYVISLLSCKNCLCFRHRYRATFPRGGHTFPSTPRRELAST